MIQDFPMRNKLATHTKYHNERVSPFLLPVLYSVSFQDYYPQQTCSFTSLNLEVIMKTDIKKTQSGNEETGGIQYTPEHLAVPTPVQPSVLVQSVDQHWQLEVFPSSHG